MDKNEILEITKKTPDIFKKLPTISKDDKDVVMEAAKQYGHSLEYASYRLKNDKKIVRAAVNNAGYSLEFASEQSRNNKEIVMTTMQNYVYSIEFARDQLRDNKGIVLFTLNNIKNIEDIKGLFGSNINELINGINNIEMVKNTLKTKIEQEQLNDNIANTKHKVKLNKLDNKMKEYIIYTYIFVTKSNKSKKKLLLAQGKSI